MINKYKLVYKKLWEVRTSFGSQIQTFDGFKEKENPLTF
jgi:hypothetical protein